MHGYYYIYTYVFARIYTYTLVLVHVHDLRKRGISGKCQVESHGVHTTSGGFAQCLDKRQAGSRGV